MSRFASTNRAEVLDQESKRDSSRSEASLSVTGGVHLVTAMISTKKNLMVYRCSLLQN